ncbi:MAG: glycosyltransferase family 4 protein [Candidatus Hydrogenedentes bacterium]|nr:glycosyltransferase family 4 protein [Candidatus Hydrogenedentota bacterium]
MDERDTPSVRVLLLHNFLSPLRVPLFEALAERFDLDVWILGDIRAVRDWPAEAPNARVRLRVLPHFSIPLGSRYNVILLNYTIARELAQLKPDAVVCCGWDTPAAFYAAWYALRTKTPFILWSGSTAAEQTTLRAITKPFVRWLVRRASAWVAYGSRAKAYLVSLGAKADKTFLAYNTVALEAMASLGAKTNAASMREQLKIRTKYVALYCGNLLDLKGVGDLIEAFARVDRGHDVTLLLVGSGKDEAQYRQRVRALGIDDRVVFTGFVGRDEVPRYYAMSDVSILPSRSEVWGLVINEALACGVPVIATDACGGAPDLIQDNVNGFVVPARNVEALAKAIGQFFAEPARHMAMREAARESIAPFTIARAADAFVDAMHCALDARG